MTSQFSPKVSEILAFSREEAARLASRSVAPEHILLGILRMKDGPVIDVFKRLDVSLKAVKAELEERVRMGEMGMPINTSELVLNEKASNILKLAVLEARIQHTQRVDEQHILLAILHDNVSNGAKEVLEQNNMTYDDVYTLLQQPKGGTLDRIDLPDEEDEEMERQGGQDKIGGEQQGRPTATQTRKPGGKTILLTTTGREWTELLAMWRKHTAIEFIARIFKTDLEGSAGVFPSVGSAYGAFLCEFLGSRIQSRLVEELSHTAFARRLDLMATTSELEKIKISRINGEWHLNEITPFQRSILESLDVEIPSDKVLRDMLDGRGK